VYKAQQAAQQNAGANNDASGENKGATDADFSEKK